MLVMGREPPQRIGGQMWTADPIAFDVEDQKLNGDIRQRPDMHPLGLASNPSAIGLSA
jgi:hypothetical protein